MNMKKIFFLVIILFSLPYSSWGGPLSPDDVFSYGPSAEQEVDVYLPKKKIEINGFIIHFHGGYGIEGDKGNKIYREIAEVFNKNGVIFMSANYRLFPRASYEEQVNDVAVAIKAALDFIDTRFFFSVVGKPIVVSSHSFGANIVAKAILDSKNNVLDRKVIERISRVVLLDGPMNMSEVAQNVDSKTWSENFGPVFGDQLNAEYLYHISPVKSAEEMKAQAEKKPEKSQREQEGDSIPKFLVAYRDKDRAIQQSLQFASALATVTEVSIISPPGYTHQEFNDRLADEGSIIFKAVMSSFRLIEPPLPGEEGG
ncbi:MAG: alpha/beta hydrolase fold domain-containing protein [Candidatus Moraniibacteriota bacterium]|nr:MAG: alpha/beta hydrolase fold domain-containing protein [Candidatus Moranbacteria bacterium]